MATMAITSTGIRQSQKLAIPSTQNSAPVLEFKCLYTHDLRRKQKRWQDGLLRYHTFNKRVMVYEVSRNYIGNTHMRDGDEVQDGDEFELDRGIIVQVGEAVGSMQQDLTDLLEKRRKPQGVETGGGSALPTRDNMSVPASTVLRGSMLPQPPQLRPKSLNTLLGTPKGRIGRAAPLTKSPFETRNENDDLESRPAKRQRIEAPTKQAHRPNQASKEQSRSQSTYTLKGQAKDIPGATDGAYQKLSLRSENEKIVHSRHQIDEEVVRFAEQSPTRRITSGFVKNTRSENITSLDDRGKTHGTERQLSRDLTRATKNTSKNPAKPLGHDPILADKQNPSSVAIIRSSESPKSGLKPIDIVSDSEPEDTKKTSKEKTRLQIAARKPRKKLMYRDLLPQEQSAPARLSSNIPCKDRQSRRMANSEESKERAREKDVLAGYHQQEQERLADRLNRADGRGSLEGSTDLFFPLEWEHGSPSVVNALKRAASKIQEPCFRNRSTTTNIENSRQDGISKKPIKSIASSTLHDTGLTLARMDEILFPRAQTPIPIEPDAPAIQTMPAQNVPDILHSTPSQSCIANAPPVRDYSPDPREPPLMKLVPSSPGFQTQGPATPPKSPNKPALTTSEVALTSPNSRAPSSDPPIDISLQSQPSTFEPPSPEHVISPIVTAQPLPRPPSPIRRPFKPPRVRSPLRKSVSDTSNMGPPARLGLAQNATTVNAPGTIIGVEGNQGPALWGKEAWDLFGCGRDGVECSYAEFKIKEGLA